MTMSVHLKKIGEGDDEQLRQAFRYFDKDESGYIEVEELREGLVEDNLDPNNDQVIRDIIFDVDLDKVLIYMLYSLYYSHINYNHIYSQ